MIKKKVGISPIIIVIVILIIAIVVGIGITISNKNNQSVFQESGTNINQNNNTVEEQEESRNESNDFLMEIDDVFYIEGTGTVVTGTVKSGKIYIGNSVEIVGMGREKQTVEVSIIEHMRERWAFAQKGDSVGIALKGVARDDVERGQVLAKPDTIKAYTEFEAEIETLSEEKGGKRTSFTDGYKPEFYFRTIGINGLVSLINVEEVKPGDKAKIKVILAKSIAMEIGTEFSIREGGRTIGSGKITKLY